MEKMNEKREYISHYINPYIKTQFNTKDLKWTRKKKKQYNLIKNLEKSKLFSRFIAKKYKNPLFIILERYKKKINFDFYEFEFSHSYERSNYGEKDILNFPISLDYLYVYDILPKENIEQYQKGIINYSNLCKKLMGAADEFSLNRSFNDMANHNYWHSVHNLGYFVINEEMNAFKWVQEIYIIFEQYSEAFYLVTYRLKLQERATIELRKIMSSLVLSEPLFYKPINKKRLTASGNHFLLSNRKNALNNMVLDVEYSFLSELNKYVPCFLHSNNVISPSLQIYTYRHLNELKKSKDVMSLLDFFVNCFDESDDKNIITNFKYFGESNVYNCIISKDFMEKNQFSLSHIDECFSPLAEYFVFQTLSPIIEQAIIRNQKRLNTLLSGNCSVGKLLKEKVKALRELNIFNRLIVATQKFSDSPYIDQYTDNFTNYLKNENINKYYSNAISMRLDNLKSKYKDFKTQIDSLYLFYDDNLKAIESSTNIRLVRYTFWITIITLLVTIFTILISLNIIPTFDKPVEASMLLFSFIK